MAVRLTAEYLQRRMRQLLLHFPLRSLHRLLQRARSLAQLQVRLTIDVGRLDVADPIGLARMQHHNVARNLLIFLNLT